MSTLITGKDAKVEVGSTQLLNSEWSLTMSSVVAEGHNTTDGTKRVSGRDDANGSVRGYRDTANPIESQVNNGDTVTLKLYTDDTKFFSLSAIIRDLIITSVMDEVQSWEFNYDLESGSVTEPV